MDVTKIRCKDFIASPKDQIAIILAWLEGYYTKESDPPIISLINGGCEEFEHLLQ
jgi:hypothetical protein